MNNYLKNQYKAKMERDGGDGEVEVEKLFKQNLLNKKCMIENGSIFLNANRGFLLRFLSVFPHF